MSLLRAVIVAAVRKLLPEALPVERPGTSLAPYGNASLTRPESRMTYPPIGELIPPSNSDRRQSVQMFYAPTPQPAPPRRRRLIVIVEETTERL